MKTRILFATLTATSLLGGASLAVAVSAGVTPSHQLPLDATYQPLLKDATIYGGISLYPLSPTSDSSVTISPAEALTTAESAAGITISDGVTEVTSLGSFTDSGLRHAASDGQDTLVANGATAYVVTFSGLSLPVLGPTGGTVTNDAVAVSAITGTVIESVEFN
jgi:hypothetical protein